MATVQDVLAVKGSHVMSVGPEATVLDAAMLMNDHKIGSLVVLSAGRVVGMFTERDVLRRVVGEHRHPDTTRVSEVMTTEVACCRPDTPLDEVRGSMRDRRIRHLPVIDQSDTLVGLISIGDLNAQQASSQEQTIYLLQEYLFGRV